MDALCGLFETISTVSEVLGRSEAKDQEISSLSSTVNSISASVQTFANSLPPEDRENAFNSNKIFSDLLEQMQKCAEVVYGPQSTVQPNAKELPNKPLLRQIGSGNTGGPLTNVVKGLVNEGLEALSSKLGGLGSLLRLPEDELEKIREASRELQRMVPLLQLAISAYTLPRGVKRPLEPDTTRPAPFLHLQTPTRELVDMDHREDLPVVYMQPISDVSWGVERLPELTSDMLRPASAALSSNSLDSNDSVARKVFGRQEVKDKLPQGCQLPMPAPPGAKNGSAGAMQPLFRFISRDLFALEPLALPAVKAPAVQGSLDMDTLVFGVPDDLGGATLGFGFDNLEEDPHCGTVEPELAILTGMNANGVHVKLTGETVWRWLAKKSTCRLKANDVIGVLLESPPGSNQNAGMTVDLPDDKVRCLLGLQLLPARQ
mmetsp:Transcript_36747/g.67369  ORF Transcript_36747/g.67369 Transcript_36747/m.67369 type:complete len:432 (-) Transcript_36747:138-1433(-)